MTIKVTETESKFVVIKTVCTCDTCGKVVTHLQYPMADNGKPYECADCFCIKMNKEATEKNKDILEAFVTSFKIDRGELSEITLKRVDGTECVLYVVEPSGYRYND